MTYREALDGFKAAAKKSGSGEWAKANAEEAEWMRKMVEAINETFRVARAVEEESK